MEEFFMKAPFSIPRSGYSLKVYEPSIIIMAVKGRGYQYLTAVPEAVTISMPLLAPNTS
jgi:hypothetical protein